MDDGEYVATINAEEFSSDLPLMSIEIPSELVGRFSNNSVRVISALYYNVEDLFPNGRPGMEK